MPKHSILLRAMEGRIQHKSRHKSQHNPSDVRVFKFILGP